MPVFAQLAEDRIHQDHAVHLQVLFFEKGLVGPRQITGGDQRVQGRLAEVLIECWYIHAAKLSNFGR